jgi:pimeloyl-ACP methyl ester carboxylesterase
MTTDPIWTALGVRLRAHRRAAGELNWLFLPGGPGIGSESLIELIDAAELPGTCWLVDLPGDGSNVDAPGAPADPYSVWPQVLLEAAAAVPEPVFVGHSTGGEYLLSVPGLEAHLRGLALISTAPDARWMPEYEAMTERDPLPGVLDATRIYESDPTNENLARCAVESAPWNFEPDGLERGAALLARMPYNGSAVEWSADNFDRDYVSSWWPASTPTLIVSGGRDRIVTQRLWDDPRFQGGHVIRARIDGAGHFPWIDRPDAVRAAMRRLADAIGAGGGAAES